MNDSTSVVEYSLSLAGNSEERAPAPPPEAGTADKETQKNDAQNLQIGEESTAEETKAKDASDGSE